MSAHPSASTAPDATSTPDAAPEAGTGADAAGTDPRVRVSQYWVEPTGYAELTFPDRFEFRLEVTDGGSEFGWGVFWRRGMFCLNKNNELARTRSGSEQSDRWLEAHRFPREEALARALAVVDSITYAGRTAPQYQAWFDALQAERGTAAATR